LSVVCAVYNEGVGVDQLLDRLAETIPRATQTFEIVLVDDGSEDDTLDRLKARIGQCPGLRVVELARNSGQVAALGAGLTVARGRRIATMDGDLQHDPADIAALLDHARRGHDLVATWRARRAEPLRRRAVTWIGNRVNRFLTGLDVRDFGSTLRVIDARIVDGLRDRYGVVSYNTPALYAGARRIVQIPVVQHRRAFGQTKWTFAMYVAYNLDFVTASPRLTHILLSASFAGALTGLALYTLKLAGVFEHVDAISAPAAILLSCLQLALLAVVWREVIQAQRFAKGMMPYRIHRVWSVEDVETDVRPE
jgi:undecaprenyl-phosphate 4-deoxy-4-formamido-L-arabinose transferase